MFFMLMSFFLLLGFSMWTPFWHSSMSNKKIQELHITVCEAYRIYL
jgi:hypothetical protein